MQGASDHLTPEILKQSNSWLVVTSQGMRRTQPVLKPRKVEEGRESQVRKHKPRLPKEARAVTLTPRRLHP